MVCPYCHTPNNHQVVESRARGRAIWRRRKCLTCKQRFSTHEQISTRTELKTLKEGRQSGHAGFRLLAEQIATLWENQTLQVSLLRRILRQLGADDSLPLAELLQPKRKGKRTNSPTSSASRKNLD